jgi:hypothetical protein
MYLVFKQPIDLNNMVTKICLSRIQTEKEGKVKIIKEICDISFILTVLIRN